MKKNIVLIAVMSLVAACQSGPTQSEMVTTIKSIETEIKGSQQPSNEKLIEYENALMLYADAFPADSLSAKYLTKAGETARVLQQFDKVLEISSKIEKTYPNSKEAAAAMFMKAFTLDNDLKRYDKAKQAYEAFIAKYPNDEFADDAQFLLNNLGKSAEEIVKEFEKKGN